MPRRAPISGVGVSRSARQAMRLDGMDEIRAAMKDIMDAPTAIEAKQVYLRAGGILAAQARANAPVSGVPPSKSPPRKKGTHLRDAIFVALGDLTKPNVLVGVSYKKAPHAHLVEYSPNHQPYFRPAITQTAGAVANEIRTGLLDIIIQSTES